MECYCCGKERLRAGFPVRTSDGQYQEVGDDCYRHVKRGGVNGHRPKNGGPTLYTLQSYETREAWEADNHERAKAFGDE